MPTLIILASIRWDFLWQRHQALAQAAAADGWEVWFVNSYPRNLRQVASMPTRLMRRRSDAKSQNKSAESARSVPNVQVLNIWNLRRLPRRPGLVIAYTPDVVTLVVLRLLKPSQVLYDAVLNWESVPRDWFPPVGWRMFEKRLARLRCAKVSTDAEGMRLALNKRNIAAKVVPPAADEPFLTLRSDLTIWEKRVDRVLYFGSIRQEIDVQLLIDIARHTPVDVIGLVEDRALETTLRTAGVHLRPPMAVPQLAAEAIRYKILALPYVGPRASTLAPAKLYNCAATGAWLLVSGIDTSNFGSGALISVDSSSDVAADIADAFRSPPEDIPSSALASWRDRWIELLAYSNSTRPPA